MVRLVAETRRIRWKEVLAVLALVLALSSAPVGLAGTISEVPDPISPTVKDFQLLSEDEGWVLAEQRLYWTADSGQTWQDITPPGLRQTAIRAVTFFDAQHGWVVGTRVEEPGIVTYILAQTSDCGATWHQKPLVLFELGDPGSLAVSVHLYLHDPQTGWLVVKQATGSNFSLGSLFWTTNGGDQWTRLTIPIGAPVYFATPEIGWTAGGPAGDQLYRTRDGGQTWQPQAVGTQSGQNIAQGRLYQLPTFDTPSDGVLPLVSVGSGGARVEFYATSDSGQTWSLATSVPLSQEIAAGIEVPLSVADADHWVMRVPNSRQLLHIVDRTEMVVVCGQGLPAGVIAELDMVTTSVGWATVMGGKCASDPQPEPGPVPSRQDAARCRQGVVLVSTNDGGRTWTTLSLPVANPPLGSRDESAPAPALDPAAEERGAIRALGSRTEPFVGHGFDVCEVPNLDQLQTWIASSPYDAVNLYIGGSCRACSNTGLTAEFLTQASQQGWRFIPTWVGPQSACWGGGCSSRISNDPSIAYNQGASEADSALAVAISLGLAEPDGSGTIVYYDLEGYGGADPSCRNAAKSFINGWTARLHQRGSEAGVYTSSCGGAISDFTSISNVPDAIWPAHWIYSYYNDNATVWGLACLSDSLWANHQRIRQYTGGHIETWGGVTLNIDCDVIDGIVANVRGTCCGCLPANCCSAMDIAQTSSIPTESGWTDPDAFGDAMLLPSTSTETCGTASAKVGALILEEEVASDTPGTAAFPDMEPPTTAEAPPHEPVEVLPADAAPIDPLPAGETVAQWETVEPERIPPTSANYSIVKSVFGSGGGPKTSAHYVMNSTQGQPTDLSRRTSASYVLVPGYWGLWKPVTLEYGVYLPLVVGNR